MVEEARSEPTSKSTPSGSTKRWVKRIGFGALGIIALVLLGGGGWVYAKTSAYDASLAKVYDVPLTPVNVSTDPAVIERGRHLSRSIGACAVSDCHGSDLGGGKLTDSGPVGTMQAPNITAIMLAYDDAELARLLRHGVKKDRRTVRLMPVDEWNWLPPADIDALVSYLRTVKLIERATPGTDIKTMGKVLDALDYIPIDVARRIDHSNIPVGPDTPAPTAEYGKWLATGCRGCHGKDHMSGGAIPGTPPDFPVPLNVTPHETGLKGWTFEDFRTMAKTGKRKNGDPLASFMPVEAIGNMTEIEQRALWAYLESLPPVPFGQR